jgi:hypothetical protein
VTSWKIPQFPSFPSGVSCNIQTHGGLEEISHKALTAKISLYLQNILMSLWVSVNNFSSTLLSSLAILSPSLEEFTEATPSPYLHQVCSRVLQTQELLQNKNERRAWNYRSLVSELAFFWVEVDPRTMARTTFQECLVTPHHSFQIWVSWLYLGSHQLQDIGMSTVHLMSLACCWGPSFIPNTLGKDVSCLSIGSESCTRWSGSCVLNCLSGDKAQAADSGPGAPEGSPWHRSSL